MFVVFFFQAEDGIRDIGVTGVQTCALPILRRVCAAFRGACACEDRTMTGADKVVCQAATLLLLFALTIVPAKAQFGGFGGGGGGDMMTQMAPMLEMIKTKMG